MTNTSFVSSVGFAFSAVELEVEATFFSLEYKVEATGLLKVTN